MTKGIKPVSYENQGLTLDKLKDTCWEVNLEILTFDKIYVIFL
jgi:hypothetical protein